jgi:tRNA(adenine34) deaminase
MLNFYINRAGKNLTQERHAELEKAKTLLSNIIAKQKSDQHAADKRSPSRKAAKKITAKSTSRKSSTK